MPKKPWATEEQNDFLVNRLPGYLEAQPTKAYGVFWSRLFEDWFIRWPEEKEVFLDKPESEQLTNEDVVALGSGLKMRREKLQTWYRYRTSSTHNRRAAIATKKITTLQTRTRLPQKQELFAQMYKKIIKPVVADAIRAENAHTPAEKLAIIKRVQKETYENSSVKVKQEVEKVLAEKVSEKKLKKVSASHTPKEYQEAIDECPSILRQIIEALAERTGWSFTILMGGPEPQNDGKMTSWSFHYGENVLGNNFNAAHPSFEQTFMTPFNQFLEHVYPGSVCRSRSMIENDDEPDAQHEDSPGEVMKDVGDESSDKDETVSQSELEGRDTATRDVTVTVPVPERSDSEEPDSATAPDASPSNPSAGNSGFDGSIISLQTVRSPSPDVSPQLNSLLYKFYSGDRNAGSENDVSGAGGDSGSDGSAAFESHGCTVAPFRLSDASISANHGISPLLDQNAFGNNSPVNSMQDMGVDLDPLFYSAISNWWDDDSFLESLNNPNIDLSGSSLSSLSLMQSASDLGSYGTSVQSQPILQTPTWEQSLPSESRQPSQTTNVQSGSQLSGSHEMPNAGSAQPPLPVDAPLNALANQPSEVTVGRPADKESTSERTGAAPLNALANQPPEVADKESTSERTGAPKFSKSGRSIIPSTRLEKMNEIGSNKENITPATVSAKSSGEWAEGAKKYMLGLELGEDWKACVDAWVMIEASLEYGKGSKRSLSPADRPQEWKNWTAKGRNGARPYHITPTINDAEEFGLACVNWWHKLQPSFRHNENSSMPLPLFIQPDLEAVNDVWEPLRKGGQNGLVTVLLLFSWWGQQANNVTEVAHQWHGAIIDLRRTLEVMGKTSQKHASSSEAVLQPSKRQRRK